MIWTWSTTQHIRKRAGNPNFRLRMRAPKGVKSPSVAMVLVLLYYILYYYYSKKKAREPVTHAQNIFPVTWLTSLPVRAGDVTSSSSISSLHLKCGLNRTDILLSSVYEVHSRNKDTNKIMFLKSLICLPLILTLYLSIILDLHNFLHWYILQSWKLKRPQIQLRRIIFRLIPRIWRQWSNQY
jgi:Ca2+/Na+ antiporter